MSRSEVGNGGADDGLRIDSQMIIKTRIFHRQGGLFQAQGDFIERHQDALFDKKLGDQLILIGIQFGDDVGLIIL